jgi:heme exporter protein CcmD
MSIESLSHAQYICLSYAFTAVVLLGLLAFSLWSYVSVRRQIADTDAK